MTYLLRIWSQLPCFYFPVLASTCLKTHLCMCMYPDNIRSTFRFSKRYLVKVLLDWWSMIQQLWQFQVPLNQNKTHNILTIDITTCKGNRHEINRCFEEKLVILLAEIKSCLAQPASTGERIDHFRVCSSCFLQWQRTQFVQC